MSTDYELLIHSPPPGDDIEKVYTITKRWWDTKAIEEIHLTIADFDALHQVVRNDKNSMFYAGK